VLSDCRNIVVIGEALGLTDDEVAFYDALETNDSAVKVLGDEALRAASLSPPFAPTSPSTGPCARTSARSSACW